MPVDPLLEDDELVIVDAAALEGLDQEVSKDSDVADNFDALEVEEDSEDALVVVALALCGTLKSVLLWVILASQARIKMISL